MCNIVPLLFFYFLINDPKTDSSSPLIVIYFKSQQPHKSSFSSLLNCWDRFKPTGSYDRNARNFSNLEPQMF